MKKVFSYTLFAILAAQNAFALDTVFDSLDKATEVKLAPAIKTSYNATNLNKNVSSPSVIAIDGSSIKEEKFNNALVNLDDVQVVLRQELAAVTAKYNVALQEKEKAVSNCKILKKEMNEINKKMKNVEKSKKIINQNLGNEKK